MEDDPGVGSPAITLRCDCGAEGRAQHGERWVCPNCGRTYDTSQIPAADYQAITALNRRYRVASWSIVGVMAVLVLAVAITGQILPIFAGLSVVMLSWFLYVKPVVHRRHKRAVSALTRQWNLEPE
jgi:hypothetical protein